MNVRLATVNLEVADPAHSKRFYIDALGMREDLARSHAPDFVYLESDGASLTLARPPHGAPAAPSPAIEIGFEVDDPDALREHFERLGIEGFEPRHMGWGSVLEGRDRDGHRVIAYRFERE